MELKKNQVFLLEVGEKFTPTGDRNNTSLYGESPLGLYVLNYKPTWLGEGYSSYVFTNVESSPINPDYNSLSWVLAMSGNNQYHLLFKGNENDHEIFLSGAVSPVTSLELPISMKDEDYQNVSTNFMDRFFNTGLFAGPNHSDAEKLEAYKPTGLSITINESDPEFYEYADRRSISVFAKNSPNLIGDNEDSNLNFIISSGGNSNQYFDPNDPDNLTFTFPNNQKTSISVFAIEEAGKEAYGNDFSLFTEKNVYVGAYDSDNRTCCVGGFITTEQRKSLSIPIKQGGDGLTLVSPTPTPTVTSTTSPTATPTPTVSQTPQPTPTNTPTITPSISVSATPGVTPSVTATSTPSVTPSLSVGASVPLPERIVIGKNNVPSAPSDLSQTYQRDAVSPLIYHSVDKKFRLAWNSSLSKWQLFDNQKSKLAGFTESGNILSSLFSKFVAFKESGNVLSRKYTYTIRELKGVEPIKERSMTFPIGSQEKLQSLKINVVGNKNVKLHISNNTWGDLYNEDPFHFQSTKDTYGPFQASSSSEINFDSYHGASAHRQKFDEGNKKYLYIPQYPPLSKTKQDTSVTYDIDIEEVNALNLDNANVFNTVDFVSDADAVFDGLFKETEYIVDSDVDNKYITSTVQAIHSMTPYNWILQANSARNGSNANYSLYSPYGHPPWTNRYTPEVVYAHRYYFSYSDYIAGNTNAEHIEFVPAEKAFYLHGKISREKIATLDSNFYPKGEPGWELSGQTMHVGENPNSMFLNAHVTIFKTIRLRQVQTKAKTSKSKIISIIKGDTINFTNKTNDYVLNGPFEFSQPSQKFVKFELYKTLKNDPWNPVKVGEINGSESSNTETSITFNDSMFTEDSAEILIRAIGAPFLVQASGKSYKIPQNNYIGKIVVQKAPAPDLRIPAGGIVYHQPFKAGVNYFGRSSNTPAQQERWAQWQNIFGYGVDSPNYIRDSIAIYRSQGREDSVNYEYVEIIIGTDQVSWSTINAKDLIRHINQSPVVKNLITAELLTDDNVVISKTETRDYATLSNIRTTPGFDPSLVPIPFFAKKKIYTAEGFTDDEDDTGEVSEVDYIPVDIQEVQDRFKSFSHKSSLDISVDVSSIEVDYEIFDNAWAPGEGLQLNLSVAREGLGKIKGTDTPLTLKRKRGTHYLELEKLFAKLPLMSDRTAARSSNKLFLLIEFQYDDGYVLEAKKDFIITDELVDNFEQRQNYHKQVLIADYEGGNRNFIKKSDMFIGNRAPQKYTNEFGLFNIRQEFGNDIADVGGYSGELSGYSRLKIEIPKIWRMLKDPSIRLRIMSYNLLRLGNGFVINQAGLGSAVSHGSKEEDYLFMGNSSAGTMMTKTENHINVVSSYSYNHVQTNTELADGDVSPMSLDGGYTTDIIFPISNIGDNPYFLWDNIIYTPWIKIAGDVKLYYTVSLMCGYNLEGTRDYGDGIVQGSYATMLNLLKTETDLVLGKRKPVSTYDIPTDEQYLHYYDIDRHNKFYQVVAWTDGLWGKPYVARFLNETEADGEEYKYGSAEFSNNERYILKTVPSEKAGFDGSSDEINGSIAGKYYQFKGEVIKKGRSYNIDLQGSDTKINNFAKTDTIKAALYDACYKQKEKLKSLLATYNDLFNGTHSIFNTYSRSSTMQDVTAWMEDPNNSYKIPQAAEYTSNSLLYPYASTNNIQMCKDYVKRMLFYMSSYNIPEISYSTYQSPRDGADQAFDSMPFPRVAASSHDEFRMGIRSLHTDDPSTSSYNENDLTQGWDSVTIKNPWENLDVTPKVFVGENGHLIYREPVYISIPFLNLFLNVHALNVNYRGSYSNRTAKPRSFPLNANSYNRIPFGEIHNKIASYMNITRKADASIGGQGDGGYSSMEGMVVDAWYYGQFTTIPVDVARQYNIDQGSNEIDLSQAYQDPYQSAYNSDGTYDPYATPGYGSSNNYSDVLIDIINEADRSLLQPVDILYGIKWTMVYTTKTRGKVFNFKSYETKLHEGYSNDIRPLEAYGRSFDTHKSLEGKFRTNGVTFGKTRGLDEDDPFYNVAQGQDGEEQPTVKVFKPILNHGENVPMVVDDKDFEKIFYSFREWADLGGNLSSNVDLNDGRYWLTNGFDGTSKELINNFPFMDFGMETF